METDITEKGQEKRSSLKKTAFSRVGGGGLLGIFWRLRKMHLFQSFCVASLLFIKSRKMHFLPETIRTYRGRHFIVSSSNTRIWFSDFYLFYDFTLCRGFQFKFYKWVTECEKDCVFRQILLERPTRSGARSKREIGDAFHKKVGGFYCWRKSNLWESKCESLHKCSRTCGFTLFALDNFLNETKSQQHQQQRKSFSSKSQTRKNLVCILQTIKGGLLWLNWFFNHKNCVGSLYFAIRKSFWIVFNQKPVRKSQKSFCSNRK